MNQKHYQEQLNSLRFLSKGIVTKDMKLKDFIHPCWYMETPSLWKTQRKKNELPHYPYPYQIDADNHKTTPPIGIRSSVPLGGIGAGTLELRADGSFKDLNIFNNHPASGSKIQSDKALFTLEETSSHGHTFRFLTTHTADTEDNIKQITYEGAFPVSLLTFSDPTLLVQAKLYAYSSFALWNTDACSIPAAIFSFELSNPTKELLKLGLNFTMPCFGDLIPSESGIQAGPLFLTSHDGDTVSTFGFSSLSELSQETHSVSGPNAGVHTILNLLPGQTRIVTYILSWYDSNRYFNDEFIGNYYTTRYPDVKAVEASVYQSLEQILEEINKWQKLCLDNTLPHWLQNIMINSLAPTYVTSLRTADGRFRQYESFACPDLEAVHIHFYRSLPFALFFPDLLKNTLEAFINLQRSDGFISHEYGRAGSKNIDTPDYRRDNNPLFLLDMYQYYLVTGDLNFITSHKENIKAAVLWEISACKDLGLPVKLASTYDLDKFETRDNTAYNSFNYLAGLKAAAALFTLISDQEMVDFLTETFHQSSHLVSKRLFHESYYGAWWDREKGVNPALHADSLYGQLWAFLLNLGMLTDKEEQLSHLKAELHYNNTPNGLTLLTNTDNEYQKGPNYATTWEAGSLDWSSLMLYFRQPLKESLVPAKEVADKWQDQLHDVWDIRDLYDTETGLPWCNSHYSRQQILWALPLALSGQHYNAKASTLTFCPHPEAPDVLPWFIPGAFGVLKKEQGSYHVVVFEQMKEITITVL